MICSPLLPLLLPFPRAVPHLRALLASVEPLGPGNAYFSGPEDRDAALARLQQRVEDLEQLRQVLRCTPRRTCGRPTHVLVCCVAHAPEAQGCSLCGGQERARS